MNQANIIQAKIQSVIFALRESEGTLNKTQISSSHTLLSEIVSSMGEMMDGIMPIDNSIHDDLLLSAWIKINGALACLEVDCREWVAHSLLQQVDSEFKQIIAVVQKLDS